MRNEAVRSIKSMESSKKNLNSKKKNQYDKNVIDNILKILI